MVITFGHGSARGDMPEWGLARLAPRIATAFTARRGAQRPSASALLLAVTLCGCTRYDHDPADTSANKAGFARRLGRPSAWDLKGIYSFVDELGSDSRYGPWFEISPNAHERRDKCLGLTNTTRKEGRLGRHEFPWWNPGAMGSLPVRWKANAKGNPLRFPGRDDTKGQAFHRE